MSRVVFLCCSVDAADMSYVITKGLSASEQDIVDDVRNAINATIENDLKYAVEDNFGQMRSTNNVIRSFKQCPEFKRGVFEEGLKNPRNLRKMAKELVNDEYFLDSVEFVFNSRRKR